MKNFFLAFGKIWNVIEKKDKCNFIYTFFICSLRSLHLLALPQVIACLTAKALGETTSFYGIIFPNEWSFGTILAVNFGILFVLGTFSTYARAHLSRFEGIAKSKYREKMLKNILTPRKNMDLKKSTGEVIYIVESSAEAVHSLLDVFLINVFPAMISALIALVYLFTINAFVALGAVAVAICVFAMGILRSRMDKKCFVKMDMTTSKINNNINDCINNLPFISFINSSFHEINLLQNQHKQYQKQVNKRSVIWVCYWAGLYLFEYLYMFLSIFLLWKNFGLQVLGINTIILMVSYMEKLFSPLNNMGFNINQLVNNSYRVNRISEFKPAENEIFDPGEDKMENRRLRKEKIWKIDIMHMEIEIGQFHKKDINMTFEVGKMACIVGTSGSGKTTLMGCLLGIKEYKHGDIIINNSYKVRSLFYNSPKICLTLQNGCIFDRSVLDNICYPTSVPNNYANNNIKKFNLENLILRTQDIDNINLEKVISGGERKRISFVRAASRKGDVYIFDEPTNDLDNENVNKVLATLRKLKKNHIVIIISHDKRVMSICDTIYDM